MEHVLGVAVISMAFFYTHAAAAHRDPCEGVCHVVHEYCEPVLHTCRHCRDLCAPQYPDSHGECVRWCPRFPAAAVVYRSKHGHQNANKAANGKSTFVTRREVHEGTEATWSVARNTTEPAVSVTSMDQLRRVTARDHDHPNLMAFCGTAAVLSLLSSAAVIIVLVVVYRKKKKKFAEENETSATKPILPAAV